MSSTSKHLLKSFLKSFNAAEAAWSWSLENYDSLKNLKKIILSNGGVSLSKKSNLINFYIACVKGKYPVKVVHLTCFETQRE